MPSEQASTAGRRARVQAIPATLAVAVALFLAAHLPFLITAPVDYDEANFVLGVRAFDVAAHQPHPPGYPVFIALGKLARPVSALWGAAPPERGGSAAVESRALAFWAALLGGLGLVPLFWLLRSVENRSDIALAATVVTAAAPLYWFTAARPLSDAPGLAAVVLVNALQLEAWSAHRAGRLESARASAWTDPAPLMLAAAFLSGLATGVRSQTFWLVAPLFALVLASWGSAAVRMLLACAAAWLVGAAIWLVPMLVAAGGIEPYVAALQLQATDDFAGVEMVAAGPTLARVVRALYNTLVMPWATRGFAGAALGLAAIGSLVLALRGRRVIGLLAVTFLPYAVFHVLFQETATTRYALPLLPPVAYLAMRGLRAISRRVFPIAVVAAVTALLALTLPSFSRYVRGPAPVFEAIQEVSTRLATPEYAKSVVALHHTCWRALQVSGFDAAPILPAPLRAEWLQLVDYWKRGGDGPVLFLRDPRRALMSLIDPLSREVVGRYRWWFPRQRFLGGIRPDLVDLVSIASPPGWVCGEGWHLTPEALGIAEARGRPDATAFVRRRPEAAVMIIGGVATAGTEGGRGVEVSATLDGRPLARWILTERQPQFFERLDLPAGALEGQGRFATLSITYAVPDAAGVTPGVRLMWFDLQSASQGFLVPGPGWHEREYHAALDRDWRWTSDRATLFVHAAGRDRTLRLGGESPLRYFESAPSVTLRVGGRVIGRFAPTADFTEHVPLSADDLERADGRVTVEVDRTFTPAEQGLSPDRRRLGLRIFELSLQ